MKIEAKQLKALENLTKGKNMFVKGTHQQLALSKIPVESSFAYTFAAHIFQMTYLL